MTAELEALIQRIELAEEEVFSHIFRAGDTELQIIAMPKFLWDMILETKNSAKQPVLKNPSTPIPHLRRT